MIAGEAKVPAARLAGILYITVIATGAFSEGFLHGSLIVPDDAAATAVRILSAEYLWRLGVAAQLIMYASYVGVTLIFFELFKPVSRAVSVLALAISVVAIAIGSANVLNQAAPLIILKNTTALASFSGSEIQSLAYLFLKLQGLGFTITLGFFGAYCFLIGTLIARSTFLPRFLGVLLALGGLCYTVNCFAILVVPVIANVVAPYVVLASAGELSLSIWLCLMGVNSPKWRAKLIKSAGLHP